MVFELKVNDNVKPCKYCGSTPRRYKGIENNKFWIECDGRRCKTQPSTKMYRIRGLDILAWNKERYV